MSTTRSPFFRSFSSRCPAVPSKTGDRFPRMTGVSLWWQVGHVWVSVLQIWFTQIVGRWTTGGRRARARVNRTGARRLPLARGAACTSSPRALAVGTSPRATPSASPHNWDVAAGAWCRNFCYIFELGQKNLGTQFCYDRVRARIPPMGFGWHADVHWKDSPRLAFRSVLART